MSKMNHLLSFLMSFSLLLVFLFSTLLSIAGLSSGEFVLEWQVDFLNTLKIPLLLVFDWMSLFFIATVSIISASVLFYSSSYMSHDQYFSRFIGLVISFILSMGVLILSPNFISILLGWDGLGVTSYLLVIYFQSAKSYSAGMLTALTNRLGDVGLLLTIGLTAHFGGWSFYYYNGMVAHMPPYLLVLIILTASTKSAQLPFSSWLPAAMAAPTPVSSLVHSSTLVTAGVYLLIRLNYMLSTFEHMWALTSLGLFTMFMAGMSAMGELDMKKIIALSTLSQLGLMFMTLGLGLPTLAFFHLAAHAYFKAMLFMSAGAIIHTFKDYQDLRALGSGIYLLPFSYCVFLTANLSLCGLPFMTGFFSKDLILELLTMGGPNLLIFIVAMLATLLTVIYSLRLTLLIFSGQAKSEPMFSLAEMDLIMKLSMFILLVFTCVGGMAISWLIEAHTSLIFLPMWLKVMVLLIVLSGPAVSKLIKQSKEGIFLSFLHYMWFMPFLFSSSLSNFNLTVGKMVLKVGDSSWLNLIQVQVLANIVKNAERYSHFAASMMFLKSLSLMLIFMLILI